MWVENSPLVIHEAQQARVPVITAERTAAEYAALLGEAGFGLEGVRRIPPSLPSSWEWRDERH